MDEERNCVECGKSFKIYKGRKYRKQICSIKCRNARTTRQAKQKNEPTRYLKTRFEVLSRDNFKCVYCGRTVSDGTKLLLDHVIPVSKGGITSKENLVTACEECNLGKSDKLLEERQLKGFIPSSTINSKAPNT